MALRFAFDIGTNSIGWAVLAGDDSGGDADQGQGFDLQRIIAAGARIYADGRNPKDGKSLAEMRRIPRGARRRRDRLLQRKRKLLALLAAHGLTPDTPLAKAQAGGLNPYALRARGLDQPLTLSEFGRVLIHLNQRRGFKSNRKTDGADSGVIKDAAKRLEEELRAAGAQTLGELLSRRLGESVRFRPTGDPKMMFEFYPTRAMIEHEFGLIWAAQAKHHPDVLTPSAQTAIRNAIFDQRKLKPVKPGKCTFMPEEERAPAALPSVEARVIYETLNALRYGEGVRRDRALTLQQRDLLATDLLAGKDRTFDQIRSGLKLPSGVRFSLEEMRDRIKGAETAKKLSNAKAFGKSWRAFELEAKDAIVELLLSEEDEGALVATLTAEHGLDEVGARYVANAPLPDGHARLGRTANARVLKELKTDVVVYSEACRRAGFHHSDFRDGVIHDRLPPYPILLERHTSFGTGDPADPMEKRYGRIANPTVHIGLNQLRKVVNALIDAYGPPTEIVVELARDLKQSKDDRDRERRQNAQNKERNEARRAALEQAGLPVTGDTMMRIRLWEEQKDRNSGVALCPYSLKPIAFEALFSGDVDIDHVLPVSKTLDDSPANKIVCFRAANRFKRNRSPYEAFHGENAPPVAAWADIEANAALLPRNKAWRFGPKAMEEFDKNGRDFLDRQLNETRHLARVAKAYLSALTPDVWVVTGRLTALLRGKWGLNSILGDDNRKNRDDHRHHAIDAIVIGCTSRSLLQKVATNAARAEDNDLDRVFADLPEPMPDFRDQAREIVRAITVSHKPEHGKGGALHEDTAYGIVRNGDVALGNVVYRKALDALTVKDAERVRCPNLRARFIALREEAGGDQKAFTAALRTWAKEDAETIATRTGQPRQPVRHVRLLKPEANAVPIADRRSGAPYKALVPAENWCIDIVQMRDGAWKGFAATIFDVNRKDWRPQWEREKLGGKLVMRLLKNDLVEIDDKDGARAVKRVVRLEPVAGRVRLAGHQEGGKLEDRHSDPDDPFRWDFASFSGMKERKARKVRVDEIGRILSVRTNTI